MEAKKTESGSESEPIWNIYIVHEPARFGGPFGVYVDECKEAVFDRIAKPVKILLEIPGRGLLAFKLEKAMKIYAIKKCVGWYDLSIEDLLSSLGEVLSDDFENQKSVHFASMMDID